MSKLAAPIDSTLSTYPLSNALTPVQNAFNQTLDPQYAGLLNDIFSDPATNIAANDVEELISTGQDFVGGNQIVLDTTSYQSISQGILDAVILGTAAGSATTPASLGQTLQSLATDYMNAAHANDLSGNALPASFGYSVGGNTFNIATASDGSYVNYATTYVNNDSISGTNYLPAVGEQNILVLSGKADGKYAITANNEEILLVGGATVQVTGTGNEVGAPVVFKGQEFADNVAGTKQALNQKGDLIVTGKESTLVLGASGSGTFTANGQTLTLQNTALGFVGLTNGKFQLGINEDSTDGAKGNLSLTANGESYTPTNMGGTVSFRVSQVRSVGAPAVGTDNFTLAPIGGNAAVFSIASAATVLNLAHLNGIETGEETGDAVSFNATGFTSTLNNVTRDTLQVLSNGNIVADQYSSGGALKGQYVYNASTRAVTFSANGGTVTLTGTVSAEAVPYTPPNVAYIYGTGFIPGVLPATPLASEGYTAIAFNAGQSGGTMTGNIPNGFFYNPYAGFTSYNIPVTTYNDTQNGLTITGDTYVNTTPATFNVNYAYPYEDFWIEPDGSVNGMDIMVTSTHSAVTLGDVAYTKSILPALENPTSTNNPASDYEGYTAKNGDTVNIEGYGAYFVYNAHQVTVNLEPSCYSGVVDLVGTGSTSDNDIVNADADKNFVALQTYNGTVTVNCGSGAGNIDISSDTSYLSLNYQATAYVNASNTVIGILDNIQGTITGNNDTCVGGSLIDNGSGNTLSLAEGGTVTIVNSGDNFTLGGGGTTSGITVYDQAGAAYAINTKLEDSTIYYGNEVITYDGSGNATTKTNAVAADTTAISGDALGTTRPEMTFIPSIAPLLNDTQSILFPKESAKDVIHAAMVGMGARSTTLGQDIILNSPDRSASSVKGSLFGGHSTLSMTGYIPSALQLQQHALN